MHYHCSLTLVLSNHILLLLTRFTLSYNYSMQNNFCYTCKDGNNFVCLKTHQANKSVFSIVFKHYCQ